MVVRCVLSILLVGSLAGCATTQKPTSVNQLQIRVAQMEQLLDGQGQDISELKYAVEELATNVESVASSVGSSGGSSRTTQSSSSKVTDPGSKQILRVPVTPQEVQTALKNSGYYKGAIDGKLGAGSQRAIKTFQKDHNITSDGIVGKKTWEELKNYLD